MKHKTTYTKLFLFAIIIFILSSITTLTALAQDTLPLNLDNGAIFITETGYKQGAENNETPHTGEYVITGSASSTNTIQVLSGNHDITLDNVSITIPATTATSTTQSATVCAFSIKSNADVNLTIKNTNTLISAAGYAGIHVESESKLIIDGDGILNTTGGAGRPSSGSPYYGGGAGIGGNGYNDSHQFGTIIIENGTINATGGVTSSSVNYGAGAGIGGGGMNGDYTDPTGTIIVNDGTINAEGGKCINSSDTSGGSGIGSGGCNLELTSNVSINIHDGQITATANNDGAGIGAGANCHSNGQIIIDGGHIFAYGAGEGDGSTWGGAGIGGGDMGWATNISIKGNATVFAQAGGAAAGIGGGNYSGIWDINTDTIGTITISEDAIVTAFGGSSGTNRGGAGIGAGRNYSTTHCNSGIISIKDNAIVIAYAGLSAQAIGVGSGYDFNTAISGEDVLIIDKTAALNAFNQDTTKAAHPPDVQGDGASYLVTFTLSDSNSDTFPDIDTNTDTTSNDDFTWKYTGVPNNYTLNITGEDVSYDFNSAHNNFGNWAVLLEPPNEPETDETETDETETDETETDETETDETETDETETDETETDETEIQMPPKTGDNDNIIWMIISFIVSFSILIFFKINKQKILK